MQKWEEKRLGELVFINPETISLTRYEGEIQYLDISSVNDGSIEGYRQYDITNAPSRARRVIRPGDIIYSTVRPNLKAYYFVKKCPDNAICSTGFVVLRNKKNINNRFIYSLISELSFVEYLSLVAKGSAYPAVDKNDFLRAKVRIPDFPTQNKIADILSTYDDLIENNNRRVELLEISAQELYKEWFVRFRFPGHENTKFIKGIPRDWDLKKLGQIYKFKKGKNITKENTIMGDVPVIAGGMEPSCYHNIANTKAPVITISASGANAGYIKLYYEKIWASDCSFIDNSQKNIYYAYELLNSMRKIVDNLQVGSAQPHVYPKDINRLKIIYPSKDIIELANNKLQYFHEEIAVLKEKNKNLKIQRDLLLPRLMSGKLEV